MDGWRQMAAQTVPALLRKIGTNTDALDGVFDTRRLLTVQSQKVRELRRGPWTGQIGLGRIQTVLKGALDCVETESERHAKAGHVLEGPFGRAHPNLLRTPAWQAWKEEHDSVARYADQAAGQLRGAQAASIACLKAILVALDSFPRMSVGWTMWMVAAERLSDSAYQSLSMMRHAAMMEYSKARHLIDGVDAYRGGAAMHGT